MTTNSFATHLGELLQQKRKELNELEMYCNREEETLRATANLSSHKGYNYYKTEHEKSYVAIDRKRSEIDAMILAFTQKKEAEFEAYKARWETNAETYKKNMEDIEVNITTPKSIIYKRKMTDVLRLREEIPRDAQAYDHAVEKEMEVKRLNAEYLRKQAMEEIKRADEEQKAADMKVYLARKAIDDAAEEKSRQKRIREGLEPDDDGIYHTEESYDKKFTLTP